MLFSHIVAKDYDRNIGNKGVIAWRQKKDMERFKKLTSGHVVVMGRKTYESLPGPKLPGRIKIVVSSIQRPVPKRNQTSVRDTFWVKSVDEALMLAEMQEASAALVSGKTPEVFIIGGESIYKQTMCCIDYIYSTSVFAHTTGDVKYPETPGSVWEIIASSDILQKDIDNDFYYKFMTLGRRSIAESISFGVTCDEV